MGTSYSSLPQSAMDQYVLTKLWFVTKFRFDQKLTNFHLFYTNEGIFGFKDALKMFSKI